MGKREAPPLYPLRFREILKETIWGGDGLRKVLNKKAGRRVGESLEVSLLGRDVSVVANGPWKGKPLKAAIQSNPSGVLGTDGAIRFREHFPLLIKFLCVKDRLSLQVHPSDDFAGRYEVERTGKMEAWYVVYAPKGSRVARGVLPGITAGEFRTALEEGRPDQCLNVMEIAEGDVIFIPPGTVHTAWGGLVVLEVQQNSDVTYRLTDWGRKGFDGRPRRLDVVKALAVTDFYTMGVTKFRPQRLAGYPYKRRLLLKCEKFTMELLELQGRAAHEALDGSNFRTYVVLRGRGRFKFGPKRRFSEPFAQGQTFLVPGGLGPFDIVPRGRTDIVCAYV